MAAAKRSRAVISLGKRLLVEAGLDETNDTLSRWMIHYIAEKIEEVESQKGRGRSVAERECFAAILELWEHRSVFPTKHRPFGDFESLFQTLSTLSVEDQKPRYFRAFREAAAKDSDLETAKWLDASTLVDHAARVLIRYFLAAAVEASVDKSRVWIQLAETLKGPLDFDVQIVRFVTEDADHLVRKDSNPERTRVLALIDKLDALSKNAKSLSVALNERSRRPVSGRKRKGTVPKLGRRVRAKK